MNEDVFRHFLYILPLILIIAIENLLKKLLKQRQGNACKSLHNEQTHFLIYTTKEYNYLKMKKNLDNISTVSYSNHTKMSFSYQFFSNSHENNNYPNIHFMENEYIP